MQKARLKSLDDKLVAQGSDKLEKRISILISFHLCVTERNNLQGRKIDFASQFQSGPSQIRGFG